MIKYAYYLIGDSQAALKLIDSLMLDVLIFPDWQPFPDQQSIVYQSLRLAPVQVCLSVRGTPCVSEHIDYYLMSEDIQDGILLCTDIIIIIISLYKHL